MLITRLHTTIKTITFLALGCAYSNIIASETDITNHLLPFSAEVIHQMPTSTLLMGQIYEDGQKDVNKNQNKAESYYLIAALGNNIDAQLALGEFYLKKDKALQGYLFFSIAADNGDARALSLKNSIASHLTTEEMQLAPDFIYLIKQEINSNKLSLVSMNTF